MVAEEVSSRFPWALRRCAIFMVAVLLLFPVKGTSAEASYFAGRKGLIQELNALLLGTGGDPSALDQSRGWRGVVLAPPGTPLSSLTTPFEALSTDGGSAGKLLENINSFDRPFLIQDGLAILGPLT